MNESYEIAKSKGWHDNDEIGADGTPSARQRLAWVALILTEWVELADDMSATRVVMWAIEESGKPVGALSELVDIWIRCADTLGACGDQLGGDVTEIPVFDREYDRVCYALGRAAEATRTGQYLRYAECLRAAMREAETCHLFDVPSFAEALAAKEAFNRTRSIRHGGKLA